MDDAEAMETEAVEALQRAILAYAATGELEYAEAQLVPAYAALVGLDEALAVRNEALRLADRNTRLPMRLLSDFGADDANSN